MLFTLSPQATEGAARSSLLSRGHWQIIATRAEGIYRIPYQDILSRGMDPASLRMYGSSAAPLGDFAADSDPVELQEVPLWHSGQAVYFYGEGPLTWHLNPEDGLPEHTLHPYDSRGYYYLCSRAGGKTIPMQEAPEGVADTTIKTYDTFLVHEQDKYNLLASGRVWAGEYFSNAAATQVIKFQTPMLDTQAPARLRVRFLNRSIAPARLEFISNQQLAGVMDLPVVAGIPNSDYVAPATGTTIFEAGGNPTEIQLTYNSLGQSGASGWLDYVQLWVRQHLRMERSPLIFRDRQSVHPGRLAQFEISQAPAGTQVWDITHPFAIRCLPTEQQGSVLHFRAAADSLRTYVAFHPGQEMLAPEWLPASADPPLSLDLLGSPPADMVIVSLEEFLSEARRLADFHRTQDTLQVLVVSQQEVFHQFSGGKKDPAAIRNFLKYLRTSHPQRPPRYLLLFGTGSYDYRNIHASAEGGGGIITYQSKNSFSPLMTYTSDDFFGVTAHGAGLELGHIDVATGRIPATTLAQARGVVDKIVSYHTRGPWQQEVMLLADDEDGNEHFRQSELIAGDLSQSGPQYTVRKVYLDAFQQQSTPEGNRYPEAKVRMESLLEQGILMVHYLGHGNENGLSEEKLMTRQDIEEWEQPHLPLFVVATCEFGRFDSPFTTTSGEAMLLNPKGGGIGVLTTTRLAYAHLNFEMARAVTRQMLQRNNPRIGDIIRAAKNEVGLFPNTLSFVYFGDPALRLASPGAEVRTLRINGQDAATRTDTLRPLDRVTIEGDIHSNHAVQTQFNGWIRYQIFDKPREQSTLGNDPESVSAVYRTQEEPLIQGTAPVNAGRFEIACTLPLDIAPEFGAGKITYFAWSEQADAGGAYPLVTGGLPDEIPADTTGPEITLYLNHPSFRDGGVSHERPLLVAELKDAQGISIGGGNGHDLRAQLEGTTSRDFILNSFYSPLSPDGTRGTIQYRFPELPEGHYTLTLTAWDILHNPSQKQRSFRVVRSTSPTLTRLINYPNPFSESTRFAFDHNLKTSGARIRIDIYDISGRPVRTLIYDFPAGTNSGETPQWDGTDARGKKIAPGIYIYRLSLHAEDGTTISGASRLQFLNP
jgi:hypothetical protein